MKTIVTTSVLKAASFIRKGETVAFPTETVYGLGADCFNEKAVMKIFKVKGRASDNPLIVHIHTKSQIRLLVREITESAYRIIKKFFPGPVTVILEKNDLVPHLVTAGLNTVAIRMPSMKFTREFIKKCGVPIAAPSANISGKPSSVTWEHVQNDFKGRIPCILKGPEVKYGIESTVVDCSVEPPVLLRPGKITLEELQRIIPEITLVNKSSKIKSPGMKYRHYSPEAKVIFWNTENRKLAADNENSAYIGLNKPDASFRKIKICKSPEDYASSLFSFFRECDREGFKKIYVQKVQRTGIGLAIMNRLDKAAARQ
ncbi:MAG: L-threonylcarbamoyladenylate synthase [Ignavibacteria bacterium]|nr:L-threonylcarbamoyladenylate synthase [Ignavibacteria bacterium]